MKTTYLTATEILEREHLDPPITVSEEGRFKLLGLAFKITRDQSDRTLDLVLNVYSALYWRIRGPVPSPRVYYENEPGQQGLPHQEAPPDSDAEE